MSAAIELGLLRARLDELGIECGDEYGILEFDSGEGECLVLPSQTQEGKLFVRYESAAYVDTASDALRLCGVIE